MNAKRIMMLVFLMSLLPVTMQAGFAQSTGEVAEIATKVTPGKYEGAANAKHPAWFKESFLDFGDDIDEATQAGKRLALYFWQPGCPLLQPLMGAQYGGGRH